MSGFATPYRLLGLVFATKDFAEHLPAYANEPKLPTKLPHELTRFEQFQ